MSDLKNHVESIATRLSEGFTNETNEDGEGYSAFDYLQEALDIEYFVDSRKQYLGARILVAFGGPNIWVDTRRGVVDGYWWGEHHSAGFQDSIGLDDACAELFNC